MSRESVAQETRSAHVGTPIAIWVLYVLGIVATVVLAASLLLVAIASAASGSTGIGLHISVPALVLWLCLLLAAVLTLLWRRYRAPR